MRALVIACLLVLSARAADPNINLDVLLEFNHHYAVFFRKYFGCPLEGKYSAEMCHPVIGEIDLAEFNRAKEDAKSLFGLH